MLFFLFFNWIETAWYPFFSNMACKACIVLSLQFNVSFLFVLFCWANKKQLDEKQHLKIESIRLNSVWINFFRLFVSELAHLDFIYIYYYIYTHKLYYFKFNKYFILIYIWYLIENWFRVYSFFKKKNILSFRFVKNLFRGFVNWIWLTIEHNSNLNFLFLSLYLILFFFSSFWLPFLLNAH